jgi:hypothetical protein
MVKYSVDSSGFGQSGDLVEFYSQSDKMYVRKTAKSDTTRLSQQFEKQKNFKSTQHIKSPAITSEWNGLYFEMEYVPGVALGNYIKYASFVELQNCVSRIGTEIEKNLKCAQRKNEQISSNAVLREKINYLETYNKELPHQYFQEALEVIKKQSKILKSLEGPNHGDFSYENILVNIHSGQIYLIDFLGSPIESPLIDIGRILIDAEFGWWKSGVRRSGTEVVAGDFISQSLRRILNHYNIEDREISYYKLLAALRIIPYTVGSVRKSVLLNVLDYELTSYWRI